MNWIDTTHLITWAQRRDSQEHLPLLVRKLIRASTGSINNIKFPSGENVLIGGWDGILEVYEETDYVPLGISLWEFGTNKDIKGKADDDFQKRSENPLGYDPKEATYIFVTARRWTKKSEWIAERKAENIWKDVKVYDAEDLEEWIENMPTVGAWLAIKHLGIMPSEGIQPADDFWEEWSTGGKINFVPEAVLAGRNIQSKQLLEHLSEPTIIAVQGNSREEALAFVVATFLNDVEHAEDFFSRSIIIDRVDAFRELIIQNQPLYLICRFDDDSVLNRARSKGHTVIAPIGHDHTGEWSEKIMLPPLERDAFVQAMVKSGMTEDQAEDLSKKSARNLIVVRRQLEFKRLNPEWSLPDNVKDLLPAILVGRWDENFEDDRKVISMMAGEDYEIYIKRLHPWSFSSDAPIVKIGSSWRLTSPMDAWTHAARYFTKDDFRKLGEATSEILTIADKKFELLSENRHRASWYGIKAKHSAWLREGLIQSLILSSIYGEKLSLDVPEHPVVWVDNIIYQVLGTENPDRWRSLDYDMYLLAEASPTAYINMVEKYLATEPSPVMGLFIEDPGYIDSHTYYTGLLWALEALAWMPNFLSRVTLILGELSAKDPGGKLQNRPINSLREIFRTWFPQTYAPLSSRIESLKLLQQKFPDIARTLLINLLPQGGRSHASPTHKMRWRLSDQPRRPGASYDEILKTHSAVIDLLIETFDRSENQFAQLLDLSANVYLFDRERLFHFLEAEQENVNINGTEAWDTLRKILGSHRSHSTADWALSEDVLLGYERIYDRLSPDDDVKKVWWLFTSNFPHFPEGRKRSSSHSEQAEELQKRRNAALSDIYRRHGFAKFIELSGLVSDQQAHIFGFTLGNVISNDIEVVQLADFLKAEDKRIVIFQTFLQRKVFCETKEWLFALFEKLKGMDYTSEVLSKLFIKLRAERNVWDFIDNRTDQTLADHYWKSVDTTLLYISDEEREFVIRKFIEYKRLSSAIYEISHHPEAFKSVLIVEVLQNFLKTEPEPNVPFNNYEVENIFEQLEKRGDVDDATMIQLEWLYMPILGSFYGRNKTPRLSKAMADDPEFFIQVLCLVYKPDGGEEYIESEKEEDISDSQKHSMAENAFRLLFHWSTVPGVLEDNTIDEDKLNNWVRIVREKAAEKYRLAIADDQIGKIMATFPEPNPKMEPEKDLSWPPDPICKVIEDIGTQQVLSGFRVECYNKRGSSSRGPFDGGIRERHLVDYFTRLAAEKAFRYPKLATVFSNLARGYAQEGREEDERAERDRLDY